MGEISFKTIVTKKWRGKLGIGADSKFKLDIVTKIPSKKDMVTFATWRLSGWLGCSTLTTRLVKSVYTYLIFHASDHLRGGQEWHQCLHQEDDLG